MNKELEIRKTRVDDALKAVFANENTPQRAIYEAMRYSLEGGGKRIRPVLLLEFARVSGARESDAMPFACALEMIHTYSLIHDDMPCMDDDDLRRGRETSHKKFGEGLAMLAGDGLLNSAFELMLGAKAALPAEVRLAAALEIAAASGCAGMIGGQVLDIENEHNAEITAEEVEEINLLKTCALFRAACGAGALLAGADAEHVAAARRCGEAIGMAFQLRDDLLDFEQDAKIGKKTYASLKGAAETARRIDGLTGLAFSELDAFCDTEFLRGLALFLRQRAV